MNKALLTERLRVVPDYPKRGIMFFDVTTLFKDKECFAEIVDAMYELYKDKGITCVAGIESRGLVAAAALAHRLGAGFVPVRKPGKLPYTTISEKYSKEYGFDTIEMHTDSIRPDDVVLIHDDIWATGGTAAAAVSLVKKFNPKAVYVNFIINITDIPRTKPISPDVEVSALLNLKESDYHNI
jgi:adenine phosphoribosyltransferase